MDRDASLDLLLHLVGQAVVGVPHVGPQRVATGRRHLQRPQDGPERRPLLPRHVDVPDVLRSGTVLASFEVDHLGNLTLGKQRMHLQFTPVTREVAVLGPGDLLITEEDDFPFQQGPAQFFDRLRTRIPQIHAVDLRTDERRHRPHLELRVGLRRETVGAPAHPARSELDRMAADLDGSTTGQRCHASLLAFEGSRSEHTTADASVRLSRRVRPRQSISQRLKSSRH